MLESFIELGYLQKVRFSDATWQYYDSRVL
jgi:hypothetical protein